MASTSKMNKEFQKRVQKGVDPEEHTRKVMKKIAEHRHSTLNINPKENKGEKESDGR